MSQREMVCIVCPVGCRLTVKEENGQLSVTGNTCPRGEKYARDEMTNPMRMVTSSLRAEGGHMKLVSVRTASPVPKASIPGVLDAIRPVVVQAPIHVGQVLVQNAAGTGVDIIATREIRKQ